MNTEYLTGEMHNDALQGIIALLWPLVHEYLKDSEAPFLQWISDKTKKLNMFISPLVAFLATAGFHYAMTQSADGWRHISIDIPPTSILVHFVAQWGTQQLVYMGAIKPGKIQKAMLAELQKITVSLQNKG